MRPAGLSAHIPDPYLITLQAERGGSALHRLDPRVKAAMLAWLVLFVTLARPPWLLGAAWAATVLVYRGAGLPLRELLRWYAIPALFVLSLVLLLVWGEPGRPLLSVDGLVLTDNGVLLVLSLLARALAAVTFTLTLLMTTRYRDLARLASVLPYPVDQVVLLSYRFLFSILGMIGDLLLAVRSRGGRLVRGFATRSRLFAAVFALSFVRAFDRAERVSRAMTARGYDGRLGSPEPMPRIRRSQVAGLAFAFLALGLAAWAGVPGFGGAA
jgi:cobalt/nickel transport system permease protein